MKLYTKTGDDGTTGLFGGARVPKNDDRVMAYGEVDELNAALGTALCAVVRQDTAAQLTQIQAELFSVGAELATPADRTSQAAVDDEQVHRLERWIDEAVGEVPPLRSFVLPGGVEAAARLHFARTVCRRAERAAVNLSQKDAVRGTVLVYLNRLSDLLFAMARRENHRAGVPDIPWASDGR